MAKKEIKIENTVYLTNLYEIYNCLLTEKQKKYFEEYFFENLTLSEISENYDISRTAVHKKIKETIKKIEDYEAKLKIYQKQKLIRSIIENTDIKTKKKIEEIL